MGKIFKYSMTLFLLVAITLVILSDCFDLEKLWEDLFGEPKEPEDE